MFKRKIQSGHHLKVVYKRSLACPISLFYFLSFSGLWFQATAPTPLLAMEMETPPPVSGRALTPESILPADVLARATLVLDELEQIRFKMRKANNKRATFRVQNAAPREVYFQALTLFRKSNRLSFEQTSRMNLEQTRVSPKNIQPFHVWALVNESLKRVLLVKQKLGISKKVAERRQNEASTPNDVFALLVQVNQRVNLMLDVQFSPTEVFQEVTIGVRYAGELLAAFPESTRIFPPPPFEAGKSPSDVYQELLRAFEQVRNVLHLSGESGVFIDTKSVQSDEITPSEVFDIAALLVSELSYLHAQLFKTIDSPFEGYHPGPRFPSDVFQRVSILRAQLRELVHHVKKQPDWLRK